MSNLAAGGATTFGFSTTTFGSSLKLFKESTYTYCVCLYWLIKLFVKAEVDYGLGSGSASGVFGVIGFG